MDKQLTQFVSALYPTKMEETHKIIENSQIETSRQKNSSPTTQKV